MQSNLCLFFLGGGWGVGPELVNVGTLPCPTRPRGEGGAPHLLEWFSRPTGPPRPQISETSGRLKNHALKTPAHVQLSLESASRANLDLCPYLWSRSRWSGPRPNLSRKPTDNQPKLKYSNAVNMVSRFFSGVVGGGRTGHRRFWAASQPNPAPGGLGKGPGRGPVRFAPVFSPVGQS